MLARHKGGGMYRARLRKDLDRWSAMGLISEQQAQAIITDHDAQKSSFSIGGVLLILSAVLLSAALLLLVAANWQAIPRLLKVSAVIAMIWVFHMGGAVALAYGRGAIGQALLVLGAASFGGGLALVGQLYHLSGDPLAIFYVWIAMATLSCVLFRSGVMAGSVVVLCLKTLTLVLDYHGLNPSGEALLLPPGFAVLIMVLSFWTGYERVRHTAFLILLGWLVWLSVQTMQVGFAMAFVVGGFAVFAGVSLSHFYERQMVRLAGVYSLLLAVIGLLLLHLEYPDGLPLAVLALVAVIMSVVALIIKGRDDGVVRAIAYLIFAGATIYVAFATIDSMLDTSGFFMISGVLVALLAFGVSRLEKRLSAHRAAGKGVPGDA